jgi:hypothetical protein
MPDRTLILDHLALARRHVAEAERHVAHQREIVAQTERDGHDTATSKQLLDQFEELYRMHVADRDRLEQELDEISKWSALQVPFQLPPLIVVGCHGKLQSTAARRCSRGGAIDRSVLLSPQSARPFASRF